jgi:hypothetical protein
MAKLHAESYPMPEYKSGVSIDEFFISSDEALNAIPANKLYHEPFADGQAYYFIVSEKPLVVQHVPYADAWQLPASRIKALTLGDVRRNIETHKLMTKLLEG